MLQSLLLADNAISGTTPSSLWTNVTTLHTLTLSSNPISGTLSGPVLMKSLLLNDMALSGSLPSFSRPGLNSTLAVLSLARNYLTGSTDALEQESSLETIILSAVSVLLLAYLSLCVGSLQNYFSCEVAGLDEATGLGQGVFQDPTTEALQSAGRASLQQTGINPFASLENRNYSNTALSFAGNTQASSHLLYLLIEHIDDAQLTRGAAFIPPTAPRRLLKVDAVQDGERRLFSGGPSSHTVHTETGIVR